MGAAILTDRKHRPASGRELPYAALDGMNGALLGPEYGEEQIRAALDACGAVYHRLSQDELDDRVIASIEKVLGRKARINRLPEQPGDMPLTCADISKARKLLGYDPATPLSIGLPKFVDWFLGNVGGSSASSPML